MLFANAQIVNIPDANFKAALLADTLINTNQDGEIQLSEALVTDTIDVNNKNISDLTGIEAFINITELSCSKNNLTILDLSNNTALTKLYCSINDLNSINLNNNTALTELYCGNNQLTSLNVSNNIALTWLDCDNNTLSTIDVSNNIALYAMSCKGIQLTSLDVSNNIALVALYCNYNQLSTLDVSNNTALVELECFNNQLNSLNVKNGNNTNMSSTFFTAYGNFNLYCIEVDDSAYSANNWFNIDSQSYFSNDCNYVGVSNQLKTQELKLAPNPFNEKLSVLLPDNTNADNIEIALYNVLGKQIKVSTEKANNKIIINGANLHSGIYFVEIREQNKVIGNAKLIKQ